MLPLSASGKTHWSDELERSGITLRTKATSEIHSDKTHFCLTDRLGAYENTILVCEKDVKRSFTRDNL